MEEWLRSRLLEIEACSDSLEALWEKFRFAWTEPHRHYHTLEHLAHCVRLAENCESEFLLALYFHDAIYDPKSKENEAASAALVEPWLKDADFVGDIAVIERLVLATDHRILPKREDERRIVDIDLAILGSTRDNYEGYVANVRKEYEFVSETEWKVGRADVIRSFLDRETIYKTKEFIGIFEEPARENLLRELEELVE